MFEIRKLKSAAICKGDYNCLTYKNHPEYDKVKKQRKTMPIGSLVLAVNYGDTSYFYCPVHAAEVIKYFTVEIHNIEKEAFDLKWI